MRNGSAESTEWHGGMICRHEAGTTRADREYRNHHLDSTRWDQFVPRDDDIFVTTAYKAGTTWTQRILAALIFGPGPLRARLAGNLTVDRCTIRWTGAADPRPS